MTGNTDSDAPLFRQWKQFRQSKAQNQYGLLDAHFTQFNTSISVSTQKPSTSFITNEGNVNKPWP